MPADAEEYGLEPDALPYCRQQGWEREEVVEASEYQICRFDSAAVRGFSRTVAFTRGDNVI